MLVLLLAASVVFWGEAAHAEGPGVIEGLVVNGTPGGPPIGSIPVSLRSFRDNTQVEELVAETDPEGRFRFEELEVSPGVLYFVLAGYQDVAYSSEAIDLSEEPAFLELPVFETTTSDVEVSIQTALIEIARPDPSAGIVAVSERVTFVNGGGRTYVGDLFTNPESGGVLRIPMLEDAFGFNLGHGFGPEGVLAAPGGFVGMTPIPPGETVLIYGYSLSYIGGELSFDRRYAYPVGDFFVLIPEGAAEPSGPGLTLLGPIEFGGNPFLVLEGQEIALGEGVSVTLSGLPNPSLGGGLSLDTALRGTAIGLMALLVVGLALYAIVARRRQPLPAGGDGLAELHALDEERLALISSIAELDDSLEAGQLGGEEYERPRRRRKQRLIDVMLLISERSGGQQP